MHHDTRCGGPAPLPARKGELEDWGRCSVQNDARGLARVFPLGHVVPVATARMGGRFPGRCGLRDTMGRVRCTACCDAPGRAVDVQWNASVLFPVLPRESREVSRAPDETVCVGSVPPAKVVRTQPFRPDGALETEPVAPEWVRRALSLALREEYWKPGLLHPKVRRTLSPMPRRVLRSGLFSPWVFVVPSCCPRSARDRPLCTCYSAPGSFPGTPRSAGVRAFPNPLEQSGLSPRHPEERWRSNHTYPLE